MSNAISQKFTTGTFAFTGTNINTLESTEYTICGIGLDTSVSIQNFVQPLQEGLKNVIQSCQSSPRSDNLLIRLVTFDEQVKEFHGFKELNKCVISDYDNVMSRLGGSTALFDCAADVISSVTEYGKQLYAQDYTANGLIVLLTDGDDNNSTNTINSIKNKLSTAVGERQLESLVSILVGVNTGNGRIGSLLQDFADHARFTQYIDIAKADPKSLAKLANFISRSISSQSSSLGTGKSGIVPSLNF